jgi:transposase
VLSEILCLDSKKISHWYQDILSGFHLKKEQHELHRHDTKDRHYKSKSGNKRKKKVLVPIFKSENFGTNMAIDDKNIGGNGYTIISNKDTGKIALLIESTKASVIEEVLHKVPTNILFAVKTVSSDLAESYDWVIRCNFLCAIKIADKFHVIKLALEALQSIRIKYRQEALTEERKRYEIYKVEEENKRKKAKALGIKYQSIPYPKAKRYENQETKKELLARSRYSLFRYKSDWKEYEIERINIVFREFPELKKAYDTIVRFRNWYKRSKTNWNYTIDMKPKKLVEWMNMAIKTGITEILNFVSTVKRNTSSILNYFDEGHTNAFAESLNAKIQRFIISNYGIRNRDFFHYRLKKILS